jgi:hypothetical protein
MPPHAHKRMTHLALQAKALTWDPSKTRQGMIMTGDTRIRQQREHLATFRSSVVRSASAACGSAPEAAAAPDTLAITGRCVDRSRAGSSSPPRLDDRDLESANPKGGMGIDVRPRTWPLDSQGEAVR